MFQISGRANLLFRAGRNRIDLYLQQTLAGAAGDVLMPQPRAESLLACATAAPAGSGVCHSQRQSWPLGATSAGSCTLVCTPISCTFWHPLLLQLLAPPRSWVVQGSNTGRDYFLLWSLALAIFFIFISSFFLCRHCVDVSFFYDFFIIIIFRLYSLWEAVVRGPAASACQAAGAQPGTPHYFLTL